MRTFLYQGIEVKLTGKYAKRAKALSGDNVVFEVTPVIEDDSAPWTTRWATKSELFEVHNSNNIDNIFDT